MGGLLGTHSSLQAGFLHKVAPARVTVFRTLTGLEVLDFQFCVVLSLDDGYDSRGLIGPNVVADDGKASFGLVTCQRPPAGNALRGIFMMIEPRARPLVAVAGTPF
jgi:hypothetical protein